MSIFFSRQCEYAIQAVLYIALKPQGEMTTIKELSATLKIPYHFLAKIFQDLTYKGLLISHKGPSGGFALGMPAKDITLFHLTEAIDGTDFLHNCILGFPECSETQPCSVHSTWGTLRDAVYNMLVSKNISQLAHEMKKPAYKL